MLKYNIVFFMSGLWLLTELSVQTDTLCIGFSALARLAVPFRRTNFTRILFFSPPNVQILSPVILHVSTQLNDVYIVLML
jgi:hypothetical protein